MECLSEFWLYMRTRKKFWLLPVIIVTGLFGSLVVFDVLGIILSLGTILLVIETYVRVIADDGMQTILKCGNTPAT